MVHTTSDSVAGQENITLLIVLWSINPTQHCWNEKEEWMKQKENEIHKRAM